MGKSLILTAVLAATALAAARDQPGGTTKLKPNIGGGSGDINPATPREEEHVIPDSDGTTNGGGSGSLVAKAYREDVSPISIKGHEGWDDVDKATPDDLIAAHYLDKRPKAGPMQQLSASLGNRKSAHSPPEYIKKI